MRPIEPRLLALDSKPDLDPPHAPRQRIEVLDALIHRKQLDLTLGRRGTGQRGERDGHDEHRD
ncbi:MAG: hypothetical protein CMJ18_25100 [Phycisphaeraceae bacterium]|nr:hypothetical protein [Phycisphaeraceae bacterium]